MNMKYMNIYVISGYNMNGSILILHVHAVPVYCYY